MSVRKKKKTGLQAVLFVVISVVLIAASAIFLLNWDNYLRKGLDLEGGIYVLLEAVETGDAEADYDTIQRAMTIIRQRVDELGVVEPILQREGERRIRIELPGIEDPAQAMAVIGRTAMLTFYSPEGELLLTGANLKNAYFTRGQYNEPIVALEFDAEGREIFARATQEHLGEVIAIFLDDELVSAPTVQAVITDGSAIITGIGSAEEAHGIALMLRSGSLPVKLVELETRSVGPLLGENALRLAFSAGIVGLLLVALFMLLYYRFAGAVSVISLIVYLAVVFLVLVLLKATLTLPGLAGMILSIGMAVDANVLIFERIKEELRLGKTTLTAINTGFERALSAILDANITTVIVALVLFIVASGPVRGFAVVLLIGIVASFFSAIYLTRFLLRLAARSRIIKKPAYLGYGGE
ncbi:MAG: protein translocase subunit SecD [Bacillota bacterium]